MRIFIVSRECEFNKLQRREHTRPYYVRVQRMVLSESERDSVLYTIDTFSDLAQEGYA